MIGNCTNFTHGVGRNCWHCHEQGTSAPATATLRKNSPARPERDQRSPESWSCLRHSAEEADPEERHSTTHLVRLKGEWCSLTLLMLLRYKGLKERKLCSQWCRWRAEVSAMRERRTAVAKSNQNNLQRRRGTTVFAQKH